MQRQLSPSTPLWMKRVLVAAAVYNLVWGGLVIAAPLLLFRWAGMEDPRYPQIWQCVGMIVGVYGVGYWLAANNPLRHWPIVLVGFLGKIFGPLGFLQAAFSGALPWAWGATIITNDVIWWVPFGIILYSAFRSNTNTSRDVPFHELDEAFQLVRSHENLSLLEISMNSPTLIVFLRHSGCTFCRETLADLQRYREEIEDTGTALAVVHMGSREEGTRMLKSYGLEKVHDFSDPQCILYRAFGLNRGKLQNVFSIPVVVRGLAAMCRGHGIGLLQGDGFRMPGVFVLAKGQIVEAHRLETVSDRPDYVALASRGALHWHEQRIDGASRDETMINTA